MTRALLLVGSLLLSISLRAETYHFDQEHSKIAFQVHHLLGNARGEFHRFHGEIEVNRAEPASSRVSAEIEVASIDTGIAKRDTHLRSADFFNADKFKTIVFRSRTVRQAGAASAEIAGDLTMHGVTRPIVLRVKLTSGEGAPTRWSVATDPIKRKDFGLAFSGTAEAVSGIGEEVQTTIEIEATPQ